MNNHNHQIKLAEKVSRSNNFVGSWGACNVKHYKCLPVIFMVTNDDLQMDKSSQRSCSVRKGVLRIFTKFTGKKTVPESLF